MSSRDYIPNTFQTPNKIIDTLMALLLDSEFRVLMYMIRHIMGWDETAKNRQAHISLSKFIGQAGYGSGCGLGHGAVSAALENLAKYQIVEKIGKPGNKGQCWELRLLTKGDPDIDGLIERFRNRPENTRKQTAKARETRQAKRSVEQNSTPSVEQTNINPLSKPIKEKDSVTSENEVTPPTLQNPTSYKKTEVVNWSDVKEHFHSETGTWDDGYVYIGRGGHIPGLKKSDWGNPFTMRPEGTDDLTDERERVVEQYRAWLSDPRRCKLYNRIFTDLRGKKLVCHCAPEACHGDVLADIANYPESKPYTRWFIGVFDAFGLFMDDNGQAQVILRGMNPHVKLDPPLRDADELLALAEWRRMTQAPAVTVGPELVEAVNAWRAAQLHAPKALPKVSSTVDSDSIVQPKKPRPRDLIFDAIAEGSFGIHNGQLDQEDETPGGRIGKIKKWLVKHKPDVTPEDIQRFYIWYDSEIEASRPRDVGKFSEHWLAWEGSLTPDAPATKYYTAPEAPPVSTPEEMAEKRRIMAEAMKKRSEEA